MHLPEEQTLATLVSWLKAGRKAALATVVATWGSSPRPVGSMMAIDGDGRIEGSVSGGCIEGAVVHAAFEIMAGGAPRLLEFSVSSERAWEVGLACGGKVQVYVENIDNASGVILEKLLKAKAARMSALRVVRLADGHNMLIEGGEIGKAGLSPDISGILALNPTQSQLTSGGWFIHAFLPAPRLFIIGGVHIAQYLASMAQATGYDVTVIDPRAAFANAERFASTPILQDWPDEAMAALKPDSRTAIVTLTHDPKLDDPALHVALKSDAFYIGALGSRKTHGQRLDRLKVAGFDEAQMARIHGPAGLDIGARSPAEIAVSILAEMTIFLHGGTAS